MVVRHQHAAGRLDYLGLVGLGVVGMAPSVGNAPVPANHLHTPSPRGRRGRDGTGGSAKSR